MYFPIPLDHFNFNLEFPLTRGSRMDDPLEPPPLSQSGLTGTVLLRHGFTFRAILANSVFILFSANVLGRGYRSAHKNESPILSTRDGIVSKDAVLSFKRRRHLILISTSVVSILAFCMDVWNSNTGDLFLVSLPCPRLKLVRRGG
jgi:hypothetical protein